MTSSATFSPALLQQITTELPRRNLLDFARATYPGFQAAKHHVAIANALTAVERGEIRRLILMVPPRYGKSTLASHLFPPWYLGKHPDNRIIACSYSVDLSFDLSRKARNLISSPAYATIFPRVALASDARSVSQWELSNPEERDSNGHPLPHKGGYVSAGIGTGITGKGANVAIIDDPIKNFEEAASATIRQNHWDWYQSTLYTRLEGHAAIILILTRWSDDDLAGRLIGASQIGGDQWTVLNLPALAEADDPLGRQIDEPLWPEKYDSAAVAQVQSAIGSRNFAALYQQRPSPAGGSVFKREWWQRYSSFDRSQARQVIQVWDTAFKAKESSDYSVCATWALDDHSAYLLDVFRDRLEFPALKQKAKDLYARFRPSAVLIEDLASGQSLIQELGHDTLIPVIAVKVDADKVTRAHAVTPSIEGRKVSLPEDAPWVDYFIEEHAAFPAGAHDDMVDTTSMALKRLFGDPREFRDEDISSALTESLKPDEELFT